MQHEDRRSVSDAIESNTRRVTLDDLAREGKRFVRVVSGEKTLQLIEAIVDETIARRAGEIAEVDRTRIVSETSEQFQRVSRIQAEAESLTREQGRIIVEQRERVGELESRVKRAAGSLQRRERRLANARETILNYDTEIDRLAKQVQADADLLARLREALDDRADEVKRLQGLLATFQEERGRLEDITQKVLEKLSERNGTTARDLESRFEQTLERTLGKVQRTMARATARPHDRPVEATDALVASIFDESEQMHTNLSRLEVEASTAQDGIAKSLERLRRLRGDADANGEPELPAPQDAPGA
jgi:chromosome segregation ATPase